MINNHISGSNSPNSRLVEPCFIEIEYVVYSMYSSLSFLKRCNLFCSGQCTVFVYNLESKECIRYQNSVRFAEISTTSDSSFISGWRGCTDRSSCKFVQEDVLHVFVSIDYCQGWFHVPCWSL